MTEFDEEVLTRAMRSAKAWEMLHDPTHCGRLDTVELYELMVRAGYREEDAQVAATQRANDRLDARVKM